MELKKKYVKIQLVALDQITALDPPSNAKELEAELGMGSSVVLTERREVDILLGTDAIGLHPEFSQKNTHGKIYFSEITGNPILVGGDPIV